MTKYLNSYLFYLKNNKKLAENSLNSYRRDIEQFLHFLSLKNIDQIGTVDSETIREFLGTLQQMERSNSTITRFIASIRGFFSYLYNNDVITNQPAIGIKGYKFDKSLPDILTNADVELLLRQPKCVDVKGYRDKAMLETLYATGIRVSELIGLNINDINLEAGYIRCISSQKERVVPLYPQAIQSIYNYIAKARVYLIRDNNQEALFVNLNGQRLTRQGFWKIIKLYTKQAKINKKITPQTLRHSFAAHLYENGADLKSIQEMLGHSSVTSTQVYAQVVNSKLSQVYKKYHPKATRAN